MPYDVATVVATGACGPAPAQFGEPPGSTGVWVVSVPTVSAGASHIHVSMTDGRVFDSTVMVNDASGSCGGLFVNEDVYVPFGSDAGAGD
jgi:hypothetical protein